MELPGWIDLQVNGCGGVDFSDAGLTEEQAGRAFEQILASGTQAFLPTVVTNPAAVYERNLPLLAGLMKQEPFRSRVLGLHIEGPFISPEPGAVGAHPPDCVQPPDATLLDRMQEWSGGMVRLLTIAADVPGAEALCRHATDQGITVSLGHQLPAEGDLARLADAGARALTHLGNGIPNMLPRHPNPIWAGLAEDRLTAMIIADGHHLPGMVLKTALRAKGLDKVVVVSDASSMARMPPGEYASMNNRIVLEPSGKLWNPDKQCLVGSSAMMNDCMNHLHGLGWLSLEELQQVGHANPLRLIGFDPERFAAERVLTYDRATGFHPRSEKA